MKPDDLTLLVRTPLGDEYTVTDEAITRIAEAFLPGNAAKAGSCRVHQGPGLR